MRCENGCAILPVVAGAFRRRRSADVSGEASRPVSFKRIEDEIGEGPGSSLPGLFAPGPQR